MNALQTIPIVPPNRQEIIVRGPAPPFCRVTMKVNLDSEGKRFGGANPNENVKAAFYGVVLLPPPETNNESFYTDPARLSPEPNAVDEDETLSPELKEIAVEMVQEAGADGVEIEGTDWKFIWMPAAAQGFGQRVARVSGQLSIKMLKGVDQNGVEKYSYLPVCTFNDCFSTTGTRVGEQNPKCSQHKGPNQGFAVLEYCKKANNVITHLQHNIISFKFGSLAEKDEHCRITISDNVTIPRGFSQERKVYFDDREEAEKTYSIWQTAAMFLKFFQPNLIYKNNSVSFAIGLENEVKQELRRVGIQLRVTAILANKGESLRIPYPFGRKANSGELLQTLIDATNAALYVATDKNILYGGQTVKPGHLHTPNNCGDTIAKYKRDFGGQVKIIPIASVLRADLMKSEAELHISIYLMYLFRLRNPFADNLKETHPYSLNKTTNTSLFKVDSWERVTRFVYRECGVKIELLAI